MDIKICSIELSRKFHIHWATKTLSLVDPDGDYVGINYGPNHTVLRFHDIIAPCEHRLLCNDNHITKILQFADKLNDHDRLLVHCHAGISRSTAVAIGILVYRGLDPEKAVKYIYKVRPSMLPNEYIIHLFDKHLKLDGVLSKTVDDFIDAETEKYMGKFIIGGENGYI